MLSSFVDVLDFFIHFLLHSLQTHEIFLEFESCKSFFIELLLEAIDLALAGIGRSLGS